MRDLPTTTAVSDSLVDFRFANDSPSDSKKSKGGKKAILRVMVGRRMAAKTKASMAIHKERRVRSTSFETDYMGQRIVRSTRS